MKHQWRVKLVKESKTKLKLAWITEPTRFDLCISGIASADISFIKYSSVYSLVEIQASRWEQGTSKLKYKWKKVGE